MSQKNVDAVSSLAQADWMKQASHAFYFITQPWIEVGRGLWTKRLPLGECLLWANGAALLILLHLDRSLIKRVGLISFYPKSTKVYYLYCVALATSGFWAWGIIQASLRPRLIRRLTDVFSQAGLRNGLGKLPSYISDYPLDEFTRKLRLGRSGFSKEQFEKSKPSLESNLQVYIDEMRENRERGTLDIIYSHSPMPELSKIDNITSMSPLTFVIGKTRAKELTASLAKVPHLMVAGQTGGGKSTFLRGLITTLYLNNAGFEFTLIDLKGGLEFQTFEKLPRVKVIPSVEQAITNLKNLETILKERMSLLKANDCKDITAFFAIPKANRKASDGNTGASENLSRHILVVDEAAEMFLAGGHAASGDIQTSRRVLSQIARQGRSVGVHLIVATQRPDAKSLDPQVKANLTGVLCFQMLNDASSITVLGVGRATELPAIPGRAIWKCGAEMVEVQTPFLGTDEVDLLLESARKENVNG